MSRGDLFGLGLVLVTALFGLGWIALRSTAPAPSELESPTGELSSTAVGPSKRVPVVEVRPVESPASSPTRGPIHEWNRQAIVALEAGDFDRAILLFERCHEAAPEEPTFASNLAEALARLARREHERKETEAQAIARLERAVGLTPHREDLAQELARWKLVAEAEEGFWHDESAHFHLSYDGSREDLLHRGQRELLDAAESAYLEFGELFGRFPVEEGSPKIQVVIYRREEFSALTGIGDWAGGAFDGVVRIPLENLDREAAGLRRVLRHELVHAYVSQVGGNHVPGWLNEGIAQWLEDSSLSARRAHVQRARDRLAGKELIPLSSLQGSLASWTDSDAITLAYAQSLVFVDYIASSFGERLVFRLVEGCATGSTPEATFLERTRVELSVALDDLSATLAR